MKRTHHQYHIPVLVTVILMQFFATSLLMAQVQWPNVDPNNIALFKPAKQSSNFDDSHANRAVDGSTDGDWHHHSVSHTQSADNPWWEVNLLQQYNITSITIYNRTDGFSERLDNFTIRTSTEPFNNNSGGQVFADKQPTFTKSKTFTGNQKGQYIRIYLNGNNFLSLTEVVVNGTLVNPLLPVSPNDNLALAKPARQSSVFNYCTANRAVDGDTDGRYDTGGSIMHTQSDNKAWWEVDLGKKYLVQQVKIYNRTDGFAERLNDFNIWVTDIPKDNITQNITAFAENQPKMEKQYQTYTGQQIGRYVRVELNGKDNLNMAEVQVFGVDAGVATIGDARQDVMYEVAVYRNMSDIPTDINHKVAKSISKGMDYSRTVSEEHKSHWSLSATAKISAKFAVVDVETSVTGEGGGETTSGTDTTQGGNLTESTEDETDATQTIPAHTVRYEFRKWVINRSPVTYTLNNDTYSWFRINEPAGNPDDATAIMVSERQASRIVIPDDNWITPEKYNEILKNNPSSVVKK